MPKAGEITYLQKLGLCGQQHALNKPFSDEACWRYLIDIGSIMTLLPAPPARLLDLGVGTGWTSVFFARRGYDVIGQDIAADMVALAEKNKQQYGIESLRFVLGDYEDLDFSSEFDCAVFYDSLHHAENECSAIASVYRALKPGGVCLTLEPGEGHAVQPTSLDAMKKFGVTEKDMPPSLIIEAGRAAGFREFDIFSRPHEPEPIAAYSPPLSSHPPSLKQRVKAILALLRVKNPPIPGPVVDCFRITSIVRMRK